MRPVEAGKEDSGVVNLNAVKASATAEQKAAAEKAKPASTGLLDDDEKKAAAAAPVVPITAAKSAEVPKKKGNGAVIGAVIAVLGLAAAFAITKVNKPAETPPAPVAAESKPAEQNTKTEPTAQPATTGEAAPVAAASAEPATSAEPASGAQKVASAPQAGGNTGSAAPVASAAPDAPAAPAEPAAAASAVASAPSKPGDLKGAMAQAVGSDGKAAPTSENAEPASGPRNQNIPEKPSQGSVQAAIGTVMGGAKSCVAGADDVSRAQITFASNGSVSNVSVTGWAASHSATGCIKAALKGAKVGAFSASSFSVGVTIRP